MGGGAWRGEMSLQYLTHEPIEVSAWRSVAADQRDGASVEFLGIVRGEDDGTRVDVLEYDAYEPMAERLIAQLVEQATMRWSLHQVYIRHRLGRVAAGEVAVLVGVQAPHRDQAFDACRFLIDGIKRDAPIWKKTRDHAGAVTRGDGLLVRQSRQAFSHEPRTDKRM